MGREAGSLVCCYFKQVPSSPLLPPGNIPLWALRDFHFFSGLPNLSFLCLERKKIPLPHSLPMVTREGLCPSCCERPQVLPAAESRGLLATRSPGKLHSCIITFLRCCGTRTACCGGSWKRCVFSCSRRAGPSEGCRLQVKHRRVCCSSVLTRARFPGGGTFMGVWCIVDTWYM